ncbi:MAG: hypothetical protein ABGZ19_04480 [Verrucomicrobiales bacterium]|nr:hypothetical protein [Nitrospinaceae bacterium]
MSIFGGGRTNATITLNSSVSLSEKYNDNLFFSRLNREADYTTTVNSRLTLTFTSQNLIFSGSYLGSGEIQARHSEANRYRQTASFEIDLPFLSRQIKGVDVKITENVTYTPELPAFETREGIQSSVSNQTLTNEGIQVGRTDTFRNHAGITASYSWSQRMNTTLSYDNTITRYEAEELKDSTIHGFGLASGYQFFRRTGGTASYRATLTDFDRSEKELSHQFSMGAKHRLTSTLSFNGDLGVAKASSGPTRLTVNGGLSKGFKNGNIKFRYNSGIGSGGGVTTTSTFSKRMTGHGTWDMGQNLSASLNFGYGRNKTLSGQVFKTTTYDAGAGVTVVLLRWLNARLDYSYLNQKADGFGAVEAERNVIILSLTASAPGWRIAK